MPKRLLYVNIYTLVSYMLYDYTKSVNYLHLKTMSKTVVVHNTHHLGQYMLQIILVEGCIEKKKHTKNKSKLVYTSQNKLSTEIN